MKHLLIPESVVNLCWKFYPLFETFLYDCYNPNGAATSDDGRLLFRSDPYNRNCTFFVASTGFNTGFHKWQIKCIQLDIAASQERGFGVIAPTELQSAADADADAIDSTDSAPKNAAQNNKETTAGAGATNNTTSEEETETAPATPKQYFQKMTLLSDTQHMWINNKQCGIAYYWYAYDDISKSLFNFNTALRLRPEFSYSQIRLNLKNKLKKREFHVLAEALGNQRSKRMWMAIYKQAY